MDGASHRRAYHFTANNNNKNNNVNFYASNIIDLYGDYFMVWWITTNASTCSYNINKKKHGKPHLRVDGYQYVSFFCSSNCFLFAYCIAHLVVFHSKSEQDTIISFRKVAQNIQ